MTTEQKQLFWQGHIASWSKSQLTQKAYCRTHDLSLAQFGYWRTRLNRKAGASAKLVPVRVSNSSNTGVVLHLPAGIRLELPLPALAEALPLIYRTIKDAS